MLDHGCSDPTRQSFCAEQLAHHGIEQPGLAPASGSRGATYLAPGSNTSMAPLRGRLTGSGVMAPLAGSIVTSLPSRLVA